MLVLIALSCLSQGGPACGEEPAADIRELKLRDWHPRSMLVTKQSEPERPKYPAIDVHNHLGGGNRRSRRNAWRRT
jgi:hypothetical protein